MFQRECLLLVLTCGIHSHSNWAIECRTSCDPVIPAVATSPGARYSGDHTRGCEDLADAVIILLSDVYVALEVSNINK